MLLLGNQIYSSVILVGKVPSVYGPAYGFRVRNPKNLFFISKVLLAHMALFAHVVLRAGFRCLNGFQARFYLSLTGFGCRVISRC